MLRPELSRIVGNVKSRLTKSGMPKSLGSFTGEGRCANCQAPSSILLVTRNFPPLLGGMEKLNYELFRHLESTRPVALCGPLGCSRFVSAQTEVCENRIRPLPYFLLTTLWHASRLALRCRPRVIIAGSGLTAPVAWFVGRCCIRSRVAVYLHGLDIVADSWLYQHLWIPVIRRCDVVLTNSRNTSQLAQEHGIEPKKVHVLYPGTDLPSLNSAPAHEFRAELGLGNRQLILFVGRLTKRKGLAEFVTYALPLIIRKFPEACLVIVGQDATDMVQARRSSERARILNAAKAIGIAQNVLFAGPRYGAQLSGAYQAAQVHVLPVLDLPRDIEGFGMVAIEAAAHGLPTVAFNVGGVSDAVADGRSGALVKAGAYELFSDAVVGYLSQDASFNVSENCRAFAAGRTWVQFNINLCKLLGADE